MADQVADRTERLDVALKKGQIGPALAVILGTALGVLITTVGALAYLNTQFMSKDVAELRFNSLEKQLEELKLEIRDFTKRQR